MIFSSRITLWILKTLYTNAHESSCNLLFDVTFVVLLYIKEVFQWIRQMLYQVFIHFYIK